MLEWRPIHGQTKIKDKKSMLGHWGHTGWVLPTIAKTCYVVYCYKALGYWGNVALLLFILEMITTKIKNLVLVLFFGLDNCLFH